MALDTNQQIQEAISRSRQILIAFRPQSEGDAIAAALALALVLQKRGQQVELAADGFVAPSHLKFISAISKIKPALSPLQKFIIKVDISKNKLESLSYEVKNDQLYINITPRQGLINKSDVRTASTDFKFDLIFVLDTPDWESLGRVYDNNTELFFKTPSVNIDCNPANEHFGQINLVDIAATSVSEILFEWLQQTAADQITPEAATLLLTGMIIKTKSFKTPNVNARTLSNASRLMELGAEREKIVQNLFRSRSLSTLKLWGQALTHLKHEASIGLAWVTLNREDFRIAGADENALPEIIDELLANSPEAKIIALIYETEKTIEGQLTKAVEAIVACQPPLDAMLLTKSFQPQGGKERVKIAIPNQNLIAAETAVIENIKKVLEKTTIHNG